MAEKKDTKGYKIDKTKKIIYIFNVDKISDAEWTKFDTLKNRLGYEYKEITKVDYDKERGHEVEPDIGYRKAELLYYVKTYDKDYYKAFEKAVNDSFQKAKKAFKMKYKDYDAKAIADEYAEKEMPKAKIEMLNYMEENATAKKYEKFAILVEEDFFKALAEYNSYKNKKK